MCRFFSHVPENASSHTTHTRTYIENYSKRISANASFAFWYKRFDRHSGRCVMQRRWNQNESRRKREEAKSNGSFAYKWTENSLKSIMPEIKCANQPQSKMITVFFRIAFFLPAFNLSARQIFLFGSHDQFGKDLCKSKKQTFLRRTLCVFILSNSGRRSYEIILFDFELD